MQHRRRLAVTPQHAGNAMAEQERVVWFDHLRMSDVDRVGGKNASLGEMISQLAGNGIRVPGGFATTAFAFREFIDNNDLRHRIEQALADLDVDDVAALGKSGAILRGWITAATLPEPLEAAIRAAYEQLSAELPAPSVAVRSSATAEDLVDASFAGQQETFLNINGIDNLLHAIKEVFASLYNDRAIAYRVHKGYVHDDIALSAGVQRMVRSDIGAAGVMFTLDTESGFDQVVFINASHGLGETVVQGAVNPDEFYLYKPNLVAGRPALLSKTLGTKAHKMIYADGGRAAQSVKTVDVAQEDQRRFSISDAEAEELGRYALAIERHYQRPMDIEWGRDGEDGKLYILQARPETVQSQDAAGERLRRYRLSKRSAVLASGRAIGQKIGQGTVRLIKSASEMDRVKAGDVLVTDMTDPDWEPVMKRAAEIATRIAGYPGPVEFYVSKIAEGVAMIAAAFWPKKVIVRLSDFKSNEYSNLLGGDKYEPHEENPMIGFRGASRYIAPEFYDCFEMECRALKRVRNDMGMTNVEVMNLFVRTHGDVEEGV